MEDYDFSIELAVRDHEIDREGIVNNAVYQNYMEHARNECLKTIGLNYSEMAQKDQHLYVHEVNIKYKHPLRPDERFQVAMNVHVENNFKLTLQQDIFRLPDQKPITTATVTIIGMSGKTFGLPQQILDTYTKV